MKRAAIYIRVSTLDQAREGYSLPAQRKALETLANHKGCTVVGVYEDPGISAKDILHRPGIKRLLQDAQNEKFEVVAVWSLSRLTRSVPDLYATWELLQRHHIDLISYTEAFDPSTPTGRAMMGMLGIFAQMEREYTAERVYAAMEERAAQGKRTCHEVLGYNIVGADSFAINSDEADRVRYIYKTYLKYHSLTRVAECCADLNYRGKRGAKLTPWHLQRILTRPIYVGYNTFDGRIYKGNHPPIISLQLYDKVQRLLHHPTLKEQKRPL